jgi:uncharacterized protein
MSSFSPVDPASRLLSLDALRGIALCGILLVNITDMGGPIAMNRPLAIPSIGDPDWLIWGFSELFITGTMRGIFAMLFGVGLLLFVGENDCVDRLNLFLRRLVLLFLFGVIDATLLLWPGDILMVLALAGAVALMMHRLNPAHMVAAAAMFLIILSAWDAHVAALTTVEQSVYTPKMLAVEHVARLGDYGQALDYMTFVSWSWTANALIYQGICDVLAFMLFGMAMYRLGLFGGNANLSTLRRMMVFGYTLGIVLRCATILMVWNNEGGPTFASVLIDQPGRLAMTFGHVGLFLLLWRRGGQPILMAGFADMGRMALTLYLGQSLIAAIVFSGFGLGLWNQLSWPQLWLVALLILAVEALFAVLWFRLYRFGPLEWLWRWATYGKRPALR